MVFSREMILALESPYEQLNNGDALAENVAVLNALSDEEKKTLATKIIFGCPEDEFKKYGRHLDALRTPTHADDSTFYSVITTAYRVRQYFSALLDTRNSQPHSVFLEEFDPIPWHRFSALASALLKDNECAIAERLALCAPEESRSQIARNLEIVFLKNSFTTTVQQAFTLRRNIERLLLGAKPDQFFDSRDFDATLCTRFAHMMHVLLTDKEKIIGEKLSVVKSELTRADIQGALSMIYTDEVWQDANPFKLIAEVMAAQEKTEPRPSASASAHGLFAPPSQAAEKTGDEEHTEDLFFTPTGTSI